MSLVMTIRLLSAVALFSGLVLVIGAGVWWGFIPAIVGFVAIGYGGERG